MSGLRIFIHGGLPPPVMSPLEEEHGVTQRKHRVSQRKEREICEICERKLRHLRLVSLPAGILPDLAPVRKFWAWPPSVEIYGLAANGR
jgi:hypothetical protein